MVGVNVSLKPGNLVEKYPVASGILLKLGGSSATCESGLELYCCAVDIFVLWFPGGTKIFLARIPWLEEYIILN